MLLCEKNLFTLCLLGLLVFAQTYSFTQIGDIQIRKTNEKWLCDMIQCPQNSERCFVSKSNEEQPSVLKRVNICFSKDNTILTQANVSSPTNPNFQVRQYINSYRSGSITSTDGSIGTDLNEAAFEEKINQNMNLVHSRLQNMHNQIDRQVKSQLNNLETSIRDMKSGLANIFGHSI